MFYKSLNKMVVTFSILSFQGDRLPGHTFLHLLIYSVWSLQFVFSTVIRMNACTSFVNDFEGQT